MTNDEKFAHAFVGGIVAVTGAVVLSVPFFGFGPLLVFCGAVLVAGGVASVLDEHITKTKKRKPKGKKGVKTTSC